MCFLEFNLSVILKSKDNRLMINECNLNLFEEDIDLFEEDIDLIEEDIDVIFLFL